MNLHGHHGGMNDTEDLYLEVSQGKDSLIRMRRTVAMMTRISSKWRPTDAYARDTFNVDTSNTAHIRIHVTMLTMGPWLSSVMCTIVVLGWLECAVDADSDA